MPRIARPIYKLIFAATSLLMVGCSLETTPKDVPKDVVGADASINSGIAQNSPDGGKGDIAPIFDPPVGPILDGPAVIAATSSGPSPMHGSQGAVKPARTGNEDDDDRGSTCGNGILEDTEECDDNNRAEGDGCTSYCQLATNGCTFYQNASSSYIVCKDGQSWQASKEACAGFGPFGLANIGDSDENDFLAGLINGPSWINIHEYDQKDDARYSNWSEEEPVLSFASALEFLGFDDTEPLIPSLPLEPVDGELDGDIPNEDETPPIAPEEPAIPPGEIEEPFVPGDEQEVIPSDGEELLPPSGEDVLIPPSNSEELVPPAVDENDNLPVESEEPSGPGNTEDELIPSDGEVDLPPIVEDPSIPAYEELPLIPLVPAPVVIDVPEAQELCTGLNAKSGLWENTDCVEARPYICEIRL